ncbi:WavE lipopolysaccharide synthesis family protein [Fusobacterium varium]|uniref:WavE lipopolysaccharide synthesis n=1 Tax=Fusobacterium varium ATCC 27725 TaxID=469618 RepID=A0ABN5JIV1_FUSVA|nr:WavE lipopolysaccharide synthesis family protein [Fusobacterium varium]AVQ31520.1 hypothetical protein C4N18_09935 [Fusobacterium varium ATCC 27725]EES62852.1 hypothetical protein FVAG_00541 [Fusobacterium varium ATCC 27725]
MKLKYKNKLKRIIAKYIPKALIMIIIKLDPKDLKDKTDYFWQLKYFKKKIENFSKYKLVYKNNFKVGIIMQGPIIIEESFTYNSLKLLKFNYPHCEIVLSTWKDQKKEEIEKIEQLGIKILKNNYPEKGMENLNYQITSTIAGVDYLKKLNVEYVMKTRTDQRIYDINLDIYLINLLKEYPINNKFQKERIIGIGDNTYKYIPFSFSDMFQFGNINDIEVMWSLPLTKRRFTIEDRIKINPTIKEMQKFSNCEMYLCISFLKRTNYKIEYTLESYYKSLKERFLIVDNINIYWFKYNSLKDKTENFLLKDEKMTYNDWTNLYKSFNNIDFRILNEIELKIFQTKLYK